MKGLEKENVRLRGVSDMTLDKLILQEAERGRARRAKHKLLSPARRRRYIDQIRV